MRQEKKLTQLYAECQQTASVNYSILKADFKPINIYRFFCASLFRDAWYYSRITLKELAVLTREKTAGNFSDVFAEYLEKKCYREDVSPFIRPLHNVYHIPPMEMKCITIDKSLVKIEASAASKGLLIILSLLERYEDVALTKQNCLQVIKMSKPTLTKYLNALEHAGLVELNDGLIELHTNGIIVPNDWQQQKKQSYIKMDLPNITLNC